MTARSEIRRRPAAGAAPTEQRRITCPSPAPAYTAKDCSFASCSTGTRTEAWNYPHQDLRAQPRTQERGDKLAASPPQPTPAGVLAASQEADAPPSGFRDWVCSPLPPAAATS